MKRQPILILNHDENEQAVHSIFWRSRAASRSLAGQFALMHLRAACWKSQLVQTHGISALGGKSVRRGKATRSPATHLQGRASTDDSGRNRALNDTLVESGGGLSAHADGGSRDKGEGDERLGEHGVRGRSSNGRDELQATPRGNAMLEGGLYTDVALADAVDFPPRGARTSRPMAGPRPR